MGFWNILLDVCIVSYSPWRTSDGPTRVLSGPYEVPFLLQPVAFTRNTWNFVSVYILITRYHSVNLVISRDLVHNLQLGLSFTNRHLIDWSVNSQYWIYLTEIRRANFFWWYWQFCQFTMCRNYNSRNALFERFWTLFTNNLQNRWVISKIFVSLLSGKNIMVIHQVY